MIQDPIYQLEGKALKNGWVIGKMFKPGPDATGGNFSVSYIVDAGAKKGFLKAFDFRVPGNVTDKAEFLRYMSNLYIFERDLLDYCKTCKISMVVTSIYHGEIEEPSAPLGSIFYIVFELADGDSRRQASLKNHRDYIWCYRALHHMAIALGGLHRNKVFHQDIKPSNLLVFDGGLENKLGDLGRSHAETLISPIASLKAPGDLKYAPPEQLYMYIPADDYSRRASGDLYLLGSMLFFFFTGNMLTPALLSYLMDEHRPLSQRTGVGWTGNGRDVLPYIEEAYARCVVALEDALMTEVPAHLHQKLIPETVAVFKMLTNPAPELRGHPQNRANVNSNNFGVERFVSVFDRLGRHAAVMGKRNAEGAQQRQEKAAS